MFDRFNICKAWYVYAADYHDGQFSRAYKIFGRLEKIGFHAGAGCGKGYDSLDEDQKEIYNGLVARNY